MSSEALPSFSSYDFLKLRQELVNEGLRRRAVDLVAVLSDAKPWNDHHQKLTDHYENRMEFTERLKPIAVDLLNECIQENQQVKTAIEVNSARSRKIINILREICIDNPFEAKEVSSVEDVVKQYVDATHDEIQSLKLRVDNLDNIIRLRLATEQILRDLMESQDKIADIREALGELEDRIKPLYNEYASLSKELSTVSHQEESSPFDEAQSSGPPRFDLGITRPTIKPQSSTPARKSSSPRKCDLPGSSTDTSPEKAKDTKRPREQQSLSPVTEQQRTQRAHSLPSDSLGLGAGAGTPSSLALRYGGSTSSRQPSQSGAPRLGLEALSLQRLEAGHTEAGHTQSPEHTAITSSALATDSAVSINQLRETLQAPWGELTFGIDQDDQQALAALLTKFIKSRKAFKESEQPRAMLNKCGTLLFNSITTTKGPKAVRGRRWQTRMQNV
ncbi:MAG: hypothetical protein Q9215_004953 [Flavoplaca cf. flavocitrina]